MRDHYNLLYVELTADSLTPGKLFDAIMPGTFTDMLGQVVTLTQEDVEAIYTNTRHLIAEKKAQGLPGLPVDAQKHEKGDAACWITDVQMEGSVLRVLPMWTELGIEKVSKNLQRLFSATISRARNAIAGGTLTNWPAVEGLRPIELSEAHGVYVLAEESIDERLNRIADAFREAYAQPDPPDTAYPVEIFESHLIARMGEKMYRVPYELSGDDVAFADRDAWEEVKRAWVEAARDWLDRLSHLFQLPVEDNPSKAGTEPAEEDIDVDPKELTELIQTTVRESLSTQLAELVKPAKPRPVGESDEKGEPVTTNGAQADVPEGTLTGEQLFEFLGLESAGPEVVEATKTELLRHQETWKKAAAAEVVRMTSQIRHESEMIELSQQLTTGTEAHPRAFRGINADELKDAFMQLPRDQVPFWRKLLEGAQEHGLAEFEEIGHARTVKGTKQLPDDIAADLDAGKIELADLRNPIIAPALGDVDQYDLSKWR